MSKHDHLTGEMPRSHDLQIALMILFFAVWIVDSFVVRVTTFLFSIVPIWSNIPVGIALLLLAVHLMRASHKDLFDNHETGIAKGGVYGRLRHPMYLGTHLFYLALATMTLSLASFVVWIVAALAYNVLANYEEGLLEEQYGDEFLQYKSKVRKWIPL
ncbi:isoprenylcysteine carboxylmethyltransferase family protein [Candidatus Thorarchaeota archaeon]|nr:MAG: isoprenylcysteine carboxylmethyltransferase family protein [Candidatus Thorarchaeota archaeon]